MNLTRMLPPGPAMTISIGCGSGLFEAVLIQYCPRLHLRAIEVSHEIIRYLSEQAVDLVKGTWDLYPLAGSAAAWIFVYPREASLMDRYRKTFEDGDVGLVIWIGPRVDLQDYGNIFEDPWVKYVHEECGLSPYETMVSWRR